MRVQSNSPLRTIVVGALALALVGGRSDAEDASRDLDGAKADAAEAVRLAPG